MPPFLPSPREPRNGVTKSWFVAFAQGWIISCGVPFQSLIRALPLLVSHPYVRVSSRYVAPLGACAAAVCMGLRLGACLPASFPDANGEACALPWQPVRRA